MGHKRDKDCEEEKRKQQRAGIVAKRSLAANLEEDLDTYNEGIWTENISANDSVDEDGESMVEAILTHQGSTPIPKGKKKRQYGDSDEEDGTEYYEQYSGSDGFTPRRPQQGPSRTNVSIPGQSPLDQLIV